MVNTIFAAAELDLVMHPERWTLISSVVTEVAADPEVPARAVWSREHTERHANREILFGLSGV